MDYNAIFTAFYNLYRGDADVPDSTDDEYTIGLRLANEAINRWANYDGTYWKELFQTNKIDGSGDQLVVSGQSDYAGPTNMKEAGGLVRIIDSNGNTQRVYHILQPEEVQFRTDAAQYCYFTGDVATGFTLHLNPAPDDAVNGMNIDYVYYKTPTLFTTGASTTEMSEPYFMVHRMLANRFRISRNPYYDSAKSDAEDVLKTMQLDNNSGTWDNPWKLADNSGSMWGQAERGW